MRWNENAIYCGFLLINTKYFALFQEFWHEKVSESYKEEIRFPSGYGVTFVHGNLDQAESEVVILLRRSVDCEIL